MTDEEAAAIQGRWAWISRDLLPDASQAKTDIRALLDERAALVARETQLLAIIDGMSKGTVHLMSNRAVDEHGNEYPIIVEKQP